MMSYHKLMRTRASNNVFVKRPLNYDSSVLKEHERACAVYCIDCRSKQF